MYKKLVIIIVLLILLLGAIFIFRESNNSRVIPNKSNITKIRLLKYIPKDNDYLLISNAQLNKIDIFVKENFSHEEQENLKAIKDSIFSFVGIGLKEKIEDVYDGEFAISANLSSNSKNFITILKIKEKKESRDLLITKDGMHQINKIEEIENLNDSDSPFFLYQTDDNYLIIASNKNLIEESTISINNDKTRFKRELLLSKLVPELINERVLLISTNQIINNFEKEDNKGKILTIFKFNKKNIKLNSYLINNYSEGFNLSEYKNINKSFLDIKNNNVIVSNNIIQYKNYLSPTKKNKFEAKIINLIKNINNKHVLIKFNSNDWTLGFIKSNSDDFNLEDSIFLKDFSKKNLKVNDLEYSVYSRDSLTNTSEEIIYTKENPIFKYESPDLTLLSNNLSNLTNKGERDFLVENYLHNDKNGLFENIIFDDELLLSNNFVNEFIKEFPLIKYLNYFTSNSLDITFKNLHAIIKQKIPEKNQKIYAEANISLF